MPRVSPMMYERQIEEPQEPEDREWPGDDSVGLSRIKLGAASSREFGTMEALELLELGIHGKWAMWRALASLADTDSRLRGRDYDALLRRAERQRDSVESQRLQIARTSLRPAA